MRLGGEYDRVEPHLLRQFKKYAVNYIEQKGSGEWYWISMAQHYGLPTRVLDWTYSPQVALHFATANVEKSDRDGAIWLVNYKKIHERAYQKVSDHIKQTKLWILTEELMAQFFPSLKEFSELGSGMDAEVFFFEPPSIDQRLYNQFAYFSVSSDPRLDLQDWLMQHPDTWKKIIIPAELKWEVRDKLDQSNISERVLFPGLDGLAAWLRRYYYPTGSASG